MPCFWEDLSLRYDLLPLSRRSSLLPYGTFLKALSCFSGLLVFAALWCYLVQLCSLRYQTLWQFLSPVPWFLWLVSLLPWKIITWISLEIASNLYVTLSFMHISAKLTLPLQQHMMSFTFSCFSHLLFVLLFSLWRRPRSWSNLSVLCIYLLSLWMGMLSGFLPL